MIPLSRIVTVALLLSSASGLRADTNAPPIVLSLQDTVRLVGDRNPKILAEREAIASARADRRTASAYPNPKLSLNHQEAAGTQTIFTGERQETAGVELPILIPGQRSSRIAKADADVAAAEARVRANVANITADACASYMRLLALQERTATLSNALSEVTQLQNTISGRAAGGAASAYDLTRVEVEVGVLAGHLETARGEWALESSQLAALLNITNGLPVATGVLEPLPLASRELFDASAQSALAPASIAAAREAAAAQAGIKAAQRARWPDLSLEGGRAFTRHPYGAADFVGLNVEIPIFDTRRGQLEKAKSDARAAQARQAAAAAETEATLRQLFESIQRRQAALDRFRTDIEPRLARLKEMSNDAYLMGRHTILELLDAEQARREVVLEKTETLSSLVEAQIRLLAMTGRLDQVLQSKAEHQ